MGEKHEGILDYCTQLVFYALGGWLGYFMGGCDGLLYALIIFVLSIISQELCVRLPTKGYLQKLDLRTFFGRSLFLLWLVLPTS